MWPRLFEKSRRDRARSFKALDRPNTLNWQRKSEYIFSGIRKVIDWDIQRLVFEK